VLKLVHRLCGVALSLALAAGNGAACSGWAPTADDRMACCTEESECPMHKGGSHSTSSDHPLTQAQADACCAASERHNSNQPDTAFVSAISSAVLGTGIVLPASVPALVLRDGWRTGSPIPIAPVPRHVLLSVFLV
jgi:hypothetical protein